MEIVHGIYSLQERHKGCVLTIGNFDGVHHGHRMLINHLTAKARELKVPSMLLTFEPLPREFFAGKSVPARLTRFRLLGRTQLQCHGNGLRLITTGPTDTVDIRQRQREDLHFLWRTPAKCTHNR